MVFGSVFKDNSLFNKGKINVVVLLVFVCVLFIILVLVKIRGIVCVWIVVGVW